MHSAFLGEYLTSSWSARMQFGLLHRFGVKVHTRFRLIHSELEFCNGLVSLVCICITTGSLESGVFTIIPVWPCRYSIRQNVI